MMKRESDSQQVFSIILWGGFEEYYIFASVIFCISAFSISLSFFKIRGNYKKLQERTKFEVTVKVYRSFETKDCQPGASEFVPIEVSSKDLIPGDLVEIPDDQIMPCDFILIKGI